jgi:hypothetical protein
VRPGAPPRLPHRTAFKGEAVADRLRAQRMLVKGRFLGGTVGYVLAEDLELYANAFARPLESLTTRQQAVLDALRALGLASPALIKEESGLLRKHVMPALHRLQQAFLVYEEQLDSGWERGWCEFTDEWPGVSVGEEHRPDAAGWVLLRFLQAHVFATFEQLKDWTSFPSRRLARLLSDLERDGAIAPRAVQGFGDGWIAAHAGPLPERPPPACVFMLGKNDTLARSHSTELKRRFGGVDVLEYLLIDGAFQGVVLDHWGFGPYDVDDVIVELPARQRKARQREVLGAVEWRYH